MEAALRRWAPALQHAAPTLVRMMLVLWLAWLLAALTWSLLPQHAQAPAIQGPASTTTRRVDAGRVANQHLFGQFAPQAVSGDAPDTTLALTLHGIVAGKRAQDSRALIVVNGDEEPYAVGAQLPGGALIRAIYPDRVMLERDGRVEALRLPKADLGQGQATGSFVSNPTAALGPSPGSLPSDLGQLRQQIVNNPQRLMDVVRAMPVRQGDKLTGYRVYPAGNSPAFAQLGLRPGDIVTAVNGIPLTDPAQSMRVLSALKTSDQISISMLRNGQAQTQVVQIPPAGAQPDPAQDPSDDSEDQQQDDDQGNNPP